MVLTKNKIKVKIRNSFGCFLSAGTQCSTTGTAEKAECKGILAAIRARIAIKLTDLEVETNNKAVAGYLAGKAVAGYLAGKTAF
ncbi:hypothetical protein FRX31_022375 [Thalictrum thalictroides]|uniref:RNase H type-1 domain-containing protein n=1 Tax=Thalictrum thalictroides TaxID=46969 RepID=A0A7J6VTY2_THATH|nr:hypothetical protein FRX31_022375 [Thalictrum thalictroides]